MSCLGPTYNPNPPRAWSRVDSICQYQNITNTPNISEYYIPYLKKTVPASQVQYYLDMLKKGNVLQYKKNNSQMTKKQKYSQIAKGLWVNRNTTWATQSDTYTNPNSTSLKRVGYSTLAISQGTPTNKLTCPQPPKPVVYSVLPETYGGYSNPPEMPNPLPLVPPPSVPPTIPDQYPVSPPPDQVVIADGGILVCSIQENICTGEIISNTQSVDNCHPTTDSDVPGPIINLCWNDGMPTYYPKERKVMTNSGNKFPEGYKGFVPA